MSRNNIYHRKTISHLEKNNYNEEHFAKFMRYIAYLIFYLTCCLHDKKQFKDLKIKFNGSNVTDEEKQAGCVKDTWHNVYKMLKLHSVTKVMLT